MKQTYDVETEWSGYSRGYSVHRVEAESEQEAKENWWDGKRIAHETVRDDTEMQEVVSVSIVYDVSTKKT